MSKIGTYYLQVTNDDMGKSTAKIEVVYIPTKSTISITQGENHE